MLTKLKKVVISGLLIVTMVLILATPSQGRVAEIKAAASQAIEDGTYDIPVSWYKLRIDRAEDYAEAIGAANLCVKNGKAVLRLELKPFYLEDSPFYIYNFNTLNVQSYDKTNVPTEYSYNQSEVLETYDVVDRYNSDTSEDVARGNKYPKVIAMNVSLGEATVWAEAYAPVMTPLNKVKKASRLVLDYTKMQRLNEGVTKLRAAISRAESIANANKNGQSDYTEASVKAMTLAVETAKASMEGTILSASKVNDALKTVNAAIQNLKEVTYKITYVLYDGKNSGSNPATFTASSEFALKSPSKAERTFGGWVVKSASGEKKTITAIEKGTKGNLTVYAKWNKITVGKTAITSLKSTTKKKAAVAWKAVSGAKGYEVTYSKYKNFSKKKTITVAALKASLSMQTSGTVYYVKVKAYKLDSTGKRVRGSDSVVKSIKIK